VFGAVKTQQAGHRDADNTPLHAMKKESNWIPFVTLKGEQNPLQRRQLAELHSRGNVDLLLQAQSHFIKVHDHEVLSLLLLFCVRMTVACRS